MNYKDIWHWPEIPVDMIPREDIQTLYSFGHYDGPGTGLISWNNKIYYASRFYVYDSKYWIIELDEEEAIYAKWFGEEWSRLFHNNMTWNSDGTHKEFVPGIFSIVEGNRFGYDHEKHFEFMQKYEVPSPKPEAKVVGWFDGWEL